MLSDTPAAAQLAGWLSGKWVSHAIHAAAQLSIADLVADGEKTVDELSRVTDTHAPSLYRLLRALASIGIFRESAPRTFQATALSDLMRDGAMKAACLMMHSPWHDQAWGELLHAVRTGQSAFTSVHDAPLFQWLARHPDAAAVFDGAMTAGRAYRDQGIATGYGYSRFSCVVDVGGGEGSLLISILNAHPHLRGILFDLPHVSDAAHRALDQAGLSGRCEVRAGNFFEKVPADGDLYLLAHVLHDWPDDRCQAILRNCRAAMSGQDGRLLLIESPLFGSNEPDRTKWLDLEMLVLTEGGQERTEREYRELLGSADLELTQIIDTGSTRKIIEACAQDGSSPERGRSR